VHSIWFSIVASTSADGCCDPLYSDNSFHPGSNQRAKKDETSLINKSNDKQDFHQHRRIQQQSYRIIDMTNHFYRLLVCGVWCVGCGVWMDV
jgi:hypothetical protein